MMSIDMLYFICKEVILMEVNNMGKNMKHALNFAIKYPGWHTWDKHCRVTKDAIRRLAERALIKTNKYGQFRLV